VARQEYVFPVMLALFAGFLFGKVQSGHYVGIPLVGILAFVVVARIRTQLAARARIRGDAARHAAAWREVVAAEDGGALREVRGG
jgi:hypothetical protein